MSCLHLDEIARLPAQILSQSVNREECTQCYDSQDFQLGVEVCLTCFNGGCVETERNHARNHVHKSGHSFTLNVKRKPKPSAQRDGEEPPAKMTKLAIVEDREEDKYEHFTTVKCWKCDREHGAELGSAKADPRIQHLVNQVMSSMSSARQSEVKAWEEELVACEHTFTLFQESTGAIPESGLAHCSACSLKENLWLCLVCGSLGCGRQQFGGLGGNGHALAHFEATGHTVSVKLGTITPEGSADIYCYTCNEERIDPDLATHLASFGINIQTQTKTEKSLTELQIEQNLKYDFSLTTEDGTALQPLFGPGLTGLANLGNSCYMASVLQSLFALPSFISRYFSLAQSHASACTIPLPADCMECQMHKVADGLLSGRYSCQKDDASSATPSSQNPSLRPVFQEGIRPTGFKTLIGKGHEEFSTMRQQDSEEFFTHLLTTLRRDMHKYKDRSEPDPTIIFSHALEQKLQCSDCKRVSYRTDESDVLSIPVPAHERGKNEEGKIIYDDVELWDCLDAMLATEALEYACPSCCRSVYALKQVKFASFPDVLVVHAKRFQLVNWVPAKLDIPLNIPPDDILEFNEKHLGTGLQSHESELPQDAPAAGALPQFNEGAISQLQAMGFSMLRSQKALLATGNQAAEAAMEWLFQHMEDPDIDAPIQLTGRGEAGPEPSDEKIGMLVDMGFTAAQARKALRETNGNVERAVEWLFNHPDDTGDDALSVLESSSSPAPSQIKALAGSKNVPVRYKLKSFISHKGPSVHSGHYVAHIRFDEEGWVLFNDEKVVKADEESVHQLKKLAYLYFFEKEDS